MSLIPTTTSSISTTIPPTFPPRNPTRHRTHGHNAQGTGKPHQRIQAKASHAGHTSSTSASSYSFSYSPSNYSNDHTVYQDINQARPSMVGWWRCCHCGGDNNPAFEMPRCVLCNHYACQCCTPLG